MRTVASGGFQRSVFDFTRAAADAAKEKVAAMRFGGRETGGEGVQGIDAVDEALGAQEIERAVDGGWRGLSAIAGQRAEDVVGASGPMGFEHDLENPAAQLGELLAPAFAQVASAAARVSAMQA